MDWTSDYAPPRNLHHDVVMGMFSTITSPAFSELVVVLTGNAVTYLPREVMLFQTLRKMHGVRPFELVFSFESPCFVKWGGLFQPTAETRLVLEEALGDVASRGFLDFLNSPPTIRVTTLSRHYEWDFPDFD